jgi:hypothetical protein
MGVSFSGISKTLLGKNKILWYFRVFRAKQDRHKKRAKKRGFGNCGIINKNGGRLYGLPLFFLPLARLDFLLLTAFSFSGAELYQRQRERATEGEKSSDKWQRQRSKDRQRHAQGHFYGL